MDATLVDSLLGYVQANKEEEVFEMVILLLLNIEYLESDKKADPKLLPKLQDIAIEVNLKCESEETYYMSLKALQQLNKVLENSSPIKIFDRLFEMYGQKETKKEELLYFMLNLAQYKSSALTRSFSTISSISSGIASSTETGRAY